MLRERESVCRGERGESCLVRVMLPKMIVCVDAVGH